MNNTYFYHDKPLFGMDIGFSSLKVMQIIGGGKQQLVSGYGVTNFDSAFIQEGVIVDPEGLAKAIYELFDKKIIGEITTKRVAAAIPAARTFNRTMMLPKLSDKELDEAVRSEAERYIPVPIEELYLDYSDIRKSEKETELFSVAVPKKVIDSYMTFIDIIGLEPVALETTISAGTRLFVRSDQSDVPTIIIDFGSISVDITIYDKALVVTGTVPGGGDIFTDLICSGLGVTKKEAHTIKTKYGLATSKKQFEILEALRPALEQLLKEIRRMIRYYEERSTTDAKIGQVVSIGGGANMPGLSEYMTDQLRLPVRMCDPWHDLNFHKLQPPNSIEKSMYVTVTGLALINPKEIFS